MTAVQETFDVSAMLASGPPQSTQGAVIDGLRDDCGPIISRILWAVRELTGRDLLAELVEPIAGDFSSVSAMQHGWLVLAQATDEVAANHAGLRDQLTEAFTGLAATSARGALAESAERHRRQAEAARLLSDQLGHVLEVAHATAEVVVAAIEFLDSLVQELLTDAALGPAGLGKAAVTAPGKVRRAITLIDRAVEAVDTLRRVTGTAIRVMRDLKVALDVTGVAVQGAGMGGHVEAGGHLGSTAEAGFR